MIFVKCKNKYRKYHPVFGNTHAGLVFHTHVWFLPNVWKSLRYLVKTTHVRFLPNTFWGWRAVTSNVWLRLGKETDVWDNNMVGGKAAMLKEKVNLECYWICIQMGGDICVCVWCRRGGGGVISVKLRIPYEIYLASIYVAISTHVWFFPHVCGKIHILHRVQLCGFDHTGVFYCTYVWK